MDKYLVSLAFVLLCLEAGWLAQDLNLVEFPWLKNAGRNSNEISLGQVTSTKRQVRRRAKTSLVWEETRKTESLFAYDSILTLDQSAAELQLDSGTKISLFENTLVTIEPPDPNGGDAGPVRLKFKRGILKTAGAKNPQSFDAGSWVVEAGQDSHITIRSKGDNVYEVENHGGVARVISSVEGKPDEKVVNAGESVELSNDKVSNAQSALEIEWMSPADGERFYTHDPHITVPIRWHGAVNEVTLRDVQSGTEQKLAVNETEGQEKTVDMGLGQFVVRISNKEKSAFARNVSVWQAPKIYLLQPLPRERMRSGADNEFVWTAPKEVSLFVWQIASDEKFEHIVKSAETGGNSTAVGDLPVGQYYWRVLGKDEQGFVVPALYSNPFVILSKPLSAPKLKAPQIKPEDESGFLFEIWKLLLPQAAADDDAPIKTKTPKHYRAEFQWESVEGAKGYAIEISETPDFRNPVVTENAKKPRFVWKDFKLGEYYWRVAARDDSGELGLFSDVAHADLHTVPRGTITPTGIVETKPTLHRAPVVVASPSPAPVQITAAAPPPTPTATPTPPPEPLRPNNPYRYAVEFGGNYVFKHFTGSDFTATEQGPFFGNMRFFIGSGNDDPSPWHVIGELSSVAAKTSDPNGFPFQDPLKNYAFRIGAFRDKPFVNAHNWGLVILNQYPVFQRNGLENLRWDTPFVGGPMMEWVSLGANDEQRLHVGVFAGAAFVAEVSASETYFITQGKGKKFTLTGELRIAPGITQGGAWWYGADGLVFLGIRW